MPSEINPHNFNFGVGLSCLSGVLINAIDQDREIKSTTCGAHSAIHLIFQPTHGSHVALEARGILGFSKSSLKILEGENDTNHEFFSADIGALIGATRVFDNRLALGGFGGIFPTFRFPFHQEGNTRSGINWTPEIGANLRFDQSLNLDVFIRPQIGEGPSTLETGLRLTVYL